MTTLTGTSGADTFAIPNPGGAVTIIGFSDAQGDKIDLTAFAGLTSLAAVQADAVQSGPDTIITIGSTQIDLQNVSLVSLAASDFDLRYTPISVTGAVTIAAGQNLAFYGPNGGDGAYDLSGSGSLTVHGTLQVQDGQASDILAGVHTEGSTGSPVFWIEPDGTVTVSSQGPGSSAYGFYSGAVAASFRNDGTFSVSATGNATAVALEAGGVFVNTGTITVTSSGGSAYGVLAGDNVGGVTNIVNSGTITAQYAVSGLLETGHLNVTNSGALNGSVIFGLAAGNELSNTGSISGHVTFDGITGEQLYDGRGGTLSGALFFASGAGATGTDVAYLGNDGETVQGGSPLLYVYGGTGADHITGGSGNSFIDGGGGNDILDGGSSGTSTVIFASATNGVTVSLALQGQAQNTGIGNETLTNFQNILGSAYNDTLEGGGPLASSLTGGGGADTFVYRSGDGYVTIQDFSAAQGDKIDLSSLTGFRSLSDVLAHASPGVTAADTLIGIGSFGLLLGGVSVSSLTAADFIFYTGPTVGPNIGGTPTTGSGTLTGTSGSDWLQGQGGNDTLHGGAGSDYLDGGAGLNTAAYDGAYRQYTVGAGGATVSGGPEGGIDDLVNIQRIQFVDGYLATSPTDTAGQVYRIYEATLGRAPDQEGLTNWVNILNSGSSLQSVVNGFVNSTEFQQVYGALDNAGFVTLLYHNVLHRDPDAGGLANWVGFLTSGQDTRAQVVLGFSESPEDIAALAAPVQQGLWIANPDAAEVARLYDTVLGRLPDLSGLTNWTNSLETGSSLQSVARTASATARSREFQSVYGAPWNNTDFVTLLYHNVLHRDPDASGLNNWVGMLASGQETRAQVVVGFSESPEHITNTAPHIDSGIWVVG